MTEGVLQPVLTPLTRSAIFLVLAISAGGEATVRAVLTNLGGLQRSVAFRAPDARLVCVAKGVPSVCSRAPSTVQSTSGSS